MNTKNESIMNNIPNRNIKSQIVLSNAEIGERIKNCRLEKQLKTGVKCNQNDLVDALNKMRNDMRVNGQACPVPVYSQTKISKIENGTYEKPISFADIALIADYFNKSVDYFVYSNYDLENPEVLEGSNLKPIGLTEEAINKVRELSSRQKENLNELFCNGFIQNILDIMDRYQLEDYEKRLLEDSQEINQRYAEIELDPNFDDLIEIYEEKHGSINFSGKDSADYLSAISILSKHDNLEYLVIQLIHRFSNFQKEINDEIGESIVTKMMKKQMHYDVVKRIYDEMGEITKAFYEYKYKLFNTPLEDITTLEDISHIK